MTGCIRQADVRVKQGDIFEILHPCHCSRKKGPPAKNPSPIPSPIEGDLLSMDGWMIVTLPKTANFAAKSSPEVGRSVGGRKEGKVSRPRLLAHSVFRCVNLALNVTPPPQPLPMKVWEKVSVELRSQNGCSPYPTLSLSESNPYFTALSVW